jgi:hypothetical protein
MKRPLCLLVALVASAFADAPTAIAIHNARIVPVSGPAIARGTVLLRNGLIEAVGANVSVPPEAWVIEAEGMTVYPGLIDGLSTVGIPETAAPAAAAGGGGGGGGGRAALAAGAAVNAGPPARGPEDRPNTNSWQKAADMVRLSDPRIETARSTGFTTTMTFPTQGIFAGQGSAIDLAGERPGNMVVADSVGQYITMMNSGFGGGFPGSLMGTIAYIRQIYLDADYYKRAHEFYAKNPRSMQRPAYDRALEGVLASPRILLPATRRVDVDRMLRFAAELKQPAILYGLTEGYKSADLLKKANGVALVNLKWPEKPAESDPDDPDVLRQLEIRDQSPSTPAVLAKNGVKFAFYSGGIVRRSDLVKAVKRAMDAGLSADDALKALTLTPAQIYGLADRLGSIEVGKIANLVVTKGDLFDEKSKVELVFVDGTKFEPVPEPPAGGPNRGGARPSSEGEQQ